VSASVIDPDMPRLLAELSLTAAAWRTDYRIGAEGHRLSIRQGKRTVADTGWRATFPEAAAIHTEQMIAACERGRARYREDDES
jgi:hypothetical protein